MRWMAVLTWVLLASAPCRAEEFLFAGRRYAVTFEAQYHNYGKQPVDVTLALPAIQGFGPRQQVSHVRMSPAPAEQRDGMAFFTFHVTTGQTVSAQVDADLDNAFWLWDGPLQPSASGPPLEDVPTDPVVVRKAQEVVGRETSAWHKALRLYDFVRGLNFQLTGTPRPSAWVLEHGTVQCYDAARLYADLCRAAGLPARAVGGVFLKSDVTRTEDLHAWTEVWLGDRWMPIDPTMGRFDDQTRSSRFAALMPGYVQVWSGESSGFFGSVSGGYTLPHFTTRYVDKGPSTRGVPLTSVFSPDLPEGQQPAPDESLRTESRQAVRDAGSNLAPLADGADDYAAGIAATLLADYAAAHRRLDRCLPQDGPLLRQSRGFLDYRERHLRDAYSEWTRALAWNPLPGDVAANLVGLFVGLEDWPSAERVARYAIRHGGGPDFDADLGDTLICEKRYPDALAAYQKAIGQSPQTGLYHAMLGAACQRIGDRPRALQELHRGLELGLPPALQSHYQAILDGLVKPESHTPPPPAAGPSSWALPLQACILTLLLTGFLTRKWWWRVGS